MRKSTRKRGGSGGTAAVYERITAEVIRMIEEDGLPPWRMPWRASSDGPRNLFRGNRYQGINVWLLLMVAAAKGYDQPYWLTYPPAQKLGGHVRKGEKSTKVVFWKI